MQAKRFKVILLIFLCFPLFSTVQAQVIVGGNMSFMHLFGGTEINTPGIGAQLEFALNEKTMVGLAGRYFFTSNFTTVGTVHAIDHNTDPRFLLVDHAHEISFAHVSVHGRRFFIGDNTAKFGIYSQLRLGMMFAPATSTLAPYDKDNYRALVDDVHEQVLRGFLITIGFGVEYQLGPARLFLEPEYNIAAQEVIFIPDSFSANLGVRFALGGK